MNKKEWFDEWFDTIYYHILYKNRDYTEAGVFLDNVIKYLSIEPESKILDLACGKGRHSIYLNKKGFDVTGVDLSGQSILSAKKSENEKLSFQTHDMRDVFESNKFDYVFNLFTSFGYFDTIEENLSVIDATMQSLKPKGRFLIDFLNPYVVINNLVSEEKKEIDNIHFNITRELSQDNYIVKKINIDDHGKYFDYMEKVKAIRRADFLNYFEEKNITVIDIFGDYQLTPYIKEKSERLIFIVEKA